MKRQQLVEIFKDRIIRGDFDRDGRLPTYEELNRQFNASHATFFHVLNQLKQDEYIVSVKRQGVFRAEHLPCRSRFALVFQSREHDNVFWSKLVREAQLMGENDRGRRFEVFRNHQGGNDDLERLVNLLERRMIAGMFCFFRSDDLFSRRVIMAYPDIPKIFSEPNSDIPNSFQIRLDSESCVAKVMEYARSIDSRRIAVIAKGEQSLMHDFARLAPQHGFDLNPDWLFAAPEVYTYAVRNLVKLLMGYPSGQRPDTLYITDDNLLPHIQAALIEIGVRVPEQLRLICHSNFPDRAETVMPVKKIGYDVRDMLEAGIAMIRGHYDGRTEKSSLVIGKYDSEIH